MRRPSGICPDDKRLDDHGHDQCGCDTDDRHAHSDDPRTTTATTNCPAGGQWGTGMAYRSEMSQSRLVAVRIGRHDCYDRIVFDVDGPAPVGYTVGYVPMVYSDAKGDPLPVRGGATLEVVVRAVERGADGSGPVLAGVGDQLYPVSQLASWTSLRAIRFAGYFEGQCTFAVGVRDKTPFRVFTMLDPAGRVREFVLDVAVA
ncbi:hypothetical protein [Kutzneria buriramensis]|uniref:AMIN-like domain-containing protein n=1 Tax=Kutzneria buriramensis TaxID=1045776 RepID=A0A3E0GZQ5_9PSEU|nr:hypothetical protein [Kutzneria buriramensis]REH34844.1 hypothetical protein BCF44_119120 [Kutzneria buriramensis]